MNLILKFAAITAFALAFAAAASDADSRAEARFARKVEKNALLAKRQAAHLSDRTEQRKARDSRSVSYKGNIVPAVVRRIEKQKTADANRAAQQEREEKARKERDPLDNWHVEIIGTSDVVTKGRHPKDAVPLIAQHPR